jgi:hypothetical protein
MSGFELLLPGEKRRRTDTRLDLAGLRGTEKRGAPQGPDRKKLATKKLYIL